MSASSELKARGFELSSSRPYGSNTSYIDVKFPCTQSKLLFIIRPLSRSYYMDQGGIEIDTSGTILRIDTGEIR